QTFWTPLLAQLPGQTDHRVGDPAIDDAFWIRTRYPEVLAEALDAPARALLARCGARARLLTLDDAGLRADADVDPAVPGGPTELLRAGVELLQRLHARVRIG